MILNLLCLSNNRKLIPDAGNPLNVLSHVLYTAGSEKVRKKTVKVPEKWPAE